MQEAVIVAATRTAIGRAIRGTLARTRPDDTAAAVVDGLLKQTGDLDPALVDDLILGCAFPEGEQGMNFARQVVLLSGLPVTTTAMSVNRFCSSGLEPIHIAALKVESDNEACIIAGGSESMSMIPMGGNKFAANPSLTDQRPGSYLGMGLTAERLAEQGDISREDQDAFAMESHMRALKAIKDGLFTDQITPLEVTRVTPTGEKTRTRTETSIFDTDEGPRADTTLKALAKLRPAFKQNGTVTAGNSSQMSDGAAAVMIVSRSFAEEHSLKPMARLVGYVTAGLDPEVMGLGPVYTIPKVLEKTGVDMGQIDFIELNEAFAAQSLAVIRKLDLDTGKTNINGGAIALGHPLGCTGAKLTVQAVHELIRRGGKYAMVTMCIGGGMGAAGIFENLT